MAKKNHISREAQDQFAVDSHRKAAEAREKGIFSEEITPIWPSPKYETCIDEDNVIRPDTSLDKIKDLKPAFDRKYGTITAANSSPLTDGAAVTLIADELRAKELGFIPKTYIRDAVFTGVDPYDQLLIGPALAIPQLLRRNKLTLADIDLIEIHEAFAAQVLSCIQAMESNDFMEEHFGTAGLGEFPMDKLNVNGGALAIGHPFGATGSRLVTTTSNELVRRDKQFAIIGICAAGGMAGAMLLERC